MKHCATVPVDYAVHDDPDQARALLEPELLKLYAEVYAEPPYSEGPGEVARFVDWFDRYTRQPGFRLVIAWSGGVPVGMALGYTLPAGTHWWDGLRVQVSPGFTCETGHRTVALIELLVRADLRRRGVASRLYDLFLAGRAEERATLLVRPEPEAASARAFYAHRGWRSVGPLQPFEGAPLYEALVRSLR